MIRWFYIFSFAFLFGCDTTSNVQPPNKNYFIKYFGGDGNQTAKDLIVNKDGTFFILGNSILSDGATKKVYLAKANAVGELISHITYGVDMDARDFLLTSDGKIAVVANKSNADILLTRFTLDLAPVDSALLFVGSANTSNENANSVTELNDGGFIVCGFVGDFNQPTLEINLRIDNQLQKYIGPGPGPWNETNGTNGTGGIIPINAGVRVIQNLAVGEYYTFGYTNANYLSNTATNVKYWAFNYKDNGLAIKNTDRPFFEQSGAGLDNTLTDAVAVPSGGYLLIGISSASTGDNLKAIITSSNYPGLVFDYAGVSHDLILKDNNSTPINLGRGSSPFATVYSSINNHNFVLANTYSTPTGKSDILLTKIDNNLANMWGSTSEPNYVQFGGDGDDTAAAVSELPDGHIMVLGTMQLGNPPAQFKIALMKLNSSGKLAD